MICKRQRHIQGSNAFIVRFMRITLNHIEYIFAIVQFQPHIIAIDVKGYVDGSAKVLILYDVTRDMGQSQLAFLLLG